MWCTNFFPQIIILCGCDGVTKTKLHERERSKSLSTISRKEKGYRFSGYCLVTLCDYELVQNTEPRYVWNMLIKRLCERGRTCGLLRTSACEFFKFGRFRKICILYFSKTSKVFVHYTVFKPYSRDMSGMWFCLG